MKSFREQTYYELLEVRRTAQAEEVRAALRRALDAYAPDSVALYALVEEEQAEALRSRLQEAARVLLDPAARAGYDRMLGPEAERPEDQALWAEDEEPADEGVSDGPYSRTEPAHLERAAPAPAGVMIANPPYGERIGSKEELAEFYPKLGSALKKNYPGWRCHFFTADLRLPKLVRLQPERFGGGFETLLGLIRHQMRGVFLDL